MEKRKKKSLQSPFIDNPLNLSVLINIFFMDVINADFFFLLGGEYGQLSHVREEDDRDGSRGVSQPVTAVHGRHTVGASGCSSTRFV